MVRIICFVFLFLLPVAAFAEEKRDLLSAWAESWPGVLMLFVISILISTLTFFADLKRSHLSSKGSGRYLALWVFGNFSFALVLLVLIVPEGTTLGTPDRTLLIYCLIASGLPEMSAYMKIQLGNSKSINLYKLREMFTNYIALRVHSASENSEWEDLQLLKYAFVGKPGLFDEKLIAFTNVCDFTDEEKKGILAFLPSANNNDLDSVAKGLLSLSTTTKNKLFSFFREDINRYQISSSAKLVRNLYPPITAAEAQSLVSNGVVTPFKFLFRTLGTSQRNKLANVTHIENNKLALLHNELWAAYRARIRRYTIAMIMFVLFLGLATFLVGKQSEYTMKAQFQNIIPDNTQRSLEDIR